MALKKRGFNLFGKKGINIWTQKSFNGFTQEIEKKLTDSKYGNRPWSDFYGTYGGDVVRIPYWPLDLKTIYDIAAFSDTLSTVFQALKREIFRNGFEIKEKFANKCKDCGKTFQNPTDQCDEPECKSTNLRKPDVEERNILATFLDKVNENDQDILDLSEQTNDDFEIADDAYWIAIKEYFFKENEIIGSSVHEVVKASPYQMRIIADMTGRPGRDEDGQKIYFCVNHRTKYHQGISSCPDCGKDMMLAFFRSQQPNGDYIYYGQNECKHRSKYHPTLTYGFSNIYAVWLKVTTLMNMDSYINTYYGKQRPPRGLLFVRTPNQESLQKMWNWTLDQFKKNPHQIPPIGIEGNDIKGKFVEFIDFMRSLDEMQFTESREEFRRTIGALYSVMPIYQADLSTSGGLNNEGLEITVTNRGIEAGQKPYNKGLYPWLLKQLKIQDYVLVLKPSEEKDEMADEQLMQARMANAQMMQQMGFEVTLNEEGTFEFEPTEVPVEPPEPSMNASPFGSPFNQGPPKPKQLTERPASPAGTQTGPKNPNFAGTPNKQLKKFIVKEIKKHSKNVYKVE